MLRRLREWGVTRVYGYPGDGSNGLNLAFHQVGADIEFVQTRHEEIAALAACAHAKLTGEVGVCMATSGPGAIHLLNGLYDAKLDHAPVLAIVGQQKRMSLGGDYQQEVDLRALFKDVASEYLGECVDPRQAKHLIDRAMRVAKAERTVTALIVPSDVQELPYEEPPREHGAVSSGAGYEPPVVVPRDVDLDRAAEALNAGDKVAMLVGAGAKGATDEVDRGGRTARRRRRQGAERARRRARRPAVRHGLDRPARDEAERRHDAGRRHAAHGRHRLPVRGVAARAGAGPRRADRHRRQARRPALPERGQPRGRRRRDAARADPAARAQGEPGVARGDRVGRRALVAPARRARAGQGRPDQPAARLPRAVTPPTRPRDRARRLRVGDELVGAPPHAAPRHGRGAVGDARDDGPGGPLRAGREARVPRPPGHRLPRRRRDADDRDQRARGPRACTRTAGRRRSS